MPAFCSRKQEFLLNFRLHFAVDSPVAIAHTNVSGVTDLVRQVLYAVSVAEVQMQINQFHRNQGYLAASGQLYSVRTRQICSFLT